MGIRSEIGLVMKGSSFSKFIKWNIDNNIIDDHNMLSFTSNIKVFLEENIVAIYWGWIKFYDSYQEVINLKTFLATLDKDEFRIQEVCAEVVDNDALGYNDGDFMDMEMYPTIDLQIEGFPDGADWNPGAIYIFIDMPEELINLPFE